MDLTFYQKLVYITGNIIHLMAFSLIIKSVIRKPKCSTSWIIFSNIIFLILDAIVYFFVPSEWYMLTGAILIYWLFMSRKPQWLLNMIYTLFTLVCFAVSEMISVYFVTTFADKSVEYVLSDERGYTLIIFVSRMATLLIAIIIYNIRKRDEVERRTPVYWALVTLAPLGCAYILQNSYNMIIGMDYQYGHYGLLIEAIILIGINYLMFFLYDELSKNYAIKENNVLLKNYIEKQEILMESERKQKELENIERHDMKNYLLSLRVYIEEGKLDELNQTINEKLQFLNIRKSIIKSNSNKLNRILDIKCSEAMDLGIKLNYNINVASELDIHINDLMVLVGNAMDNAIEAAVATANPFIDITITYIRRVLKIKIANTYSNEKKVTKDMEIATTKEGNHGWGIKSMKNIVERYDGVFEIKYDKLFELNISIPL